TRLSFFQTPSPPDPYTLSLHDALPILCRVLPLGEIGESWTPACAGTQECRVDLLCDIPRLFRMNPHARGAAKRQGKSSDLDASRSEEHTSELQSRGHLVCRLLLEKKNK